MAYGLFVNPISDNDTDFKRWGGMAQRGKHTVGILGTDNTKAINELIINSIYDVMCKLVPLITLSISLLLIDKILHVPAGPAALRPHVFGMEVFKKS